MRMTIDEAMRRVSDEYDAEVHRGDADPMFKLAMWRTTAEDWKEIDKQLPDYVAQIARVMGVGVGTILPDYVYQAARMAFRYGMRVQRKLSRPEETTTMFHSGDRYD